MDCYFKEHVHEHYIHIRFIGDVDDDMLLRYLDDIFLIPETGSKDQLVDYPEVTGLLLTAAGIFEFCNTLNDHCEAWPRHEDKKVAVIAPRNVALLAILTGRIFLSEILSTRHIPQYEFFLSEADAIKWLEAKSTEDGTQPEKG